MKLLVTPEVFEQLFDRSKRDPAHEQARLATLQRGKELRERAKQRAKPAE